MSKKTLILVLLGVFMAAAAQSTWGQTTVTGTIVVNFSITVDANIASTANISCEVSARVLDGKNLLQEVARVLATRNGATATCTVSIPYSWNLATPATDMLAMGYQILAPAEVPPSSVSALLPARQSVNPRFAAIPIPPSGSTTTENLTITF